MNKNLSQSQTEPLPRPSGNEAANSFAIGSQTPRPMIRPKRLLFIVAVLIGMALGMAWHYGVFDALRPRPPANSIMMIEP